MSKERKRIMLMMIASVVGFSVVYLCFRATGKLLDHATDHQLLVMTTILAFAAAVRR
jgi:Trk-type K+ transport system membrane component